ncbi:MAG: zinc-ribbon domain-containing protein [Lachnospiraceae bacterium]|nr:zinc-ribbon domain-containing protein [Lachnospiraceae bacterium]
MICSKCGNTLSDDAKKCLKCGALLDMADSILDDIIKENNIIADTKEKTSEADNKANEDINDNKAIDLSEDVNDAKETGFGLDDILSTKTEEKHANFDESSLDVILGQNDINDAMKAINNRNKHYNNIKTNADNISDDDDNQEMSLDEVLGSMNTTTTSKKAEKEFILTDTYESDVIVNEDGDNYKKSEEVKRARKNKKFAIIASVALVAFALLFSIFLRRRAMLDKFDSAIESKDYKTAATIYENLNSDKKNEADKIIVNKIEDIFEDYSSKKLTSEGAVKLLRKLSTIKSNVGTTISETLVDFNYIMASEELYKQGEESFENKDYETAIIRYYSVIKTDCNYADAQKKLSKAVAEYKKEKFKEAQDFVDAGDFDSAIELLKKSKELLPTDEEVSGKYQEIVDLKLAENIDDIMVTSKELAAAFDYVGAIKIMHDAVNEYGQNEELVGKYNEYKDMLKKEISDNIESKKYNRAASLTDEYALIVGQEDEITELMKDYRQYVDTGVSLNELKTLSKSGKTYYSKEGVVYSDSKESLFEHAIELLGYKNLENEGELSIKNNDYNKLKGTIGYSNYEYFKDGQGILVIKADSKVIYKSDAISAKSDDVDIDIEIPKCKSISFEWSPAPKSKDAYGLVLGDFRLCSSVKTTEEE